MPEIIQLWPGRDGADNATLSVHLMPGEQQLPLVIICPGGGYAKHGEHEGEPVGAALNRHGFHAAVLYYRLGPRHRQPAMLHDAQRAMRMVRSRAKEWRVGHAGMLGFSAGGHLTSVLAAHHDKWPCEHDDLAKRFSARPDAIALCYPVIDLGLFTHHGSLTLFFGQGNEHDPAMLDLFSTQKQVTPDSPPAFLWHTADDAAVRVQNSLEYARACIAAGVRCELHVYESGRHGLGLAPGYKDISTWMQHAAAFLHRHLD